MSKRFVVEYTGHDGINRYIGSNTKEPLASARLFKTRKNAEYQTRHAKDFYRVREVEVTIEFID